MSETGWTVGGITKQVKRLRSLPRKEDERPWADVAPEFERILQTVADSDEHAQRITDVVIDTARFCPSPLELREVAESVASARPESLPDPNCPKCGGFGQKIIERGGLSGAAPCDCIAPRPATKLAIVPLAGQPGYFPPKPIPPPTDEDWAAAEELAAKVYGPGDAA